MPSSRSVDDHIGPLAEQARRGPDGVSCEAARDALRGEIERGAGSGAGIPAEAVFAAVRRRIAEGLRSGSA